MPVINRIAEFAADMTAWRRHLHQNPELALDCHKTARFVVARLREVGVDEIHEGIATSGVVALIKGRGEGPVTGLRADMDALPIEEQTGAEWTSRVPGRMHACGHDGHTTMLLGAARYLAETRNFAGTVALIFQPAEEVIGGGRIMVEEGIMERFAIEEVFALHTDSKTPLGTISTASGALMAAVDDFEITLTGKGGHAAFPSACIDPIPCALAIGQALQALPGHLAEPHKPLVVTLTQIHAGSASNIIPETAHLAGTVRCFDEALRDVVEQRIRDSLSGLSAAYGVVGQIAYERSYPPTINHAAQASIAVDVARDLVGDDRVVAEMAPEMWSEDFSYMLQKRPGAFLYLGQGIGPSVHHPAFDFNDDASPIGASFFARLIERRNALRS